MVIQYQPNEPVADSHALSLADWEELLRPMCTMLEHAPASEMRSASVTGSLKGAGWSLQSLAALCRCLAAEHGLRQVLQVEGTSFTVRFSRREDRRLVLIRKLGPSL